MTRPLPFEGNAGGGQVAPEGAPTRAVQAILDRVMPHESRSLTSVDHKVKVSLWTDGSVVARSRGHRGGFSDAAAFEDWLGKLAAGGLPGNAFQPRDAPTIRRLWRLLRVDPED